jgi:hypothetical protein
MNQQVSAPISSRTHVVYRRTTKGQAAVMPAGMPAMDKASRQLLLLVNGFTSLDTLAQVCHFERPPDGTAQVLQTSGLIEEAVEHRRVSGRR